MNEGTSTSTHILSGWKDIANYLGKGVRTVQRYEGELRLPVRRPAGKARGSVVATKEEIDAWVAASPIQEPLKAGVTNTPPVLFVESIRQNIEKMGLLRDQMRDLRVDLLGSLCVLRQRVHSLCTEIRRNESISPEHKVIVATGCGKTPALSDMAEEFAQRKAS